MSHGLADQLQRQRALDPSISCIVQAPAGSGKTELLTRRFLALLAGVDHPEEILAITFTRKAASEMRDRIQQSLLDAAVQETAPDDAFSLEGWQLARAALTRDQANGWGLLHSPARLRVQTIDAFSTYLVRQMPVLSQFGAVPDITDKAASLYQHAADDFLSETLAERDDSPLAEALDCLLRFLDNRVPRLQQMIATLLASRDQWLRHLSAADTRDADRHYFERVISDEVEKSLSALCAVAPTRLEAALMAEVRFAQANLRVSHPDTAQDDMFGEAFPGAQHADLAVWQAFAGFLLTSDHSLRKRLNKNDGFPAGNKADVETYGMDAATLKHHKTAMMTLLQDCEQHPEFIARLGAIRGLPQSGYSDAQWQLLEALTHVLTSASTYLLANFIQHNAVDFSEVASRAAQALGTEVEPTELALSLDYRIRHLLVDEFQDTSQTQFALFEQLTAGWAPGDGHSFFAVGDPMQSIYRFREAQVALFTQAQRQGLGGLPLEPLTLSVNFRSRAQIIEWVNTTFTRVFPPEDDTQRGAVKYSASVAFHPADDRAGVHTRLLPGGDRDAEAQAVAVICADTLADFPDQGIAILLRAKSQAAPIVAALDAAGIAYSAVEMASLRERPVVRNIASLVRAVMQPGDRLQWLSVLRAPWCALTLRDLYALLHDARGVPVWSLITDEARVASLSDDGQTRLRRLRTGMQAVMQHRLRGDDAYWLESAWREIGGEACIDDPLDHQAAEVCWRTIRAVADEASLLDASVLDRRLDELFAPPSVSPEVRVQIMTVHKSKGLEFPTVILPGLDRRGRQDDKKLLNWVELAGDGEEPDLLLAPIDSADQREPILDMLRDIEKARDQNELQRVLYVATTRARDRLWLTACVAEGRDGGVREPAKGSPLQVLRPALESAWSALQLPDATDDAEQPEVAGEPVMRRLPMTWQPSATSPDFAWTLADGMDTEVDAQLDFLWAGSRARHLGTVVHRQLQRICDEGVHTWDAARVAASRPHYARLLRAAGLDSAIVSDASEQVAAALTQALNDPRGRWLLSDDHTDARAEWALTAVEAGRLVNVIIDRTFVDDDGVRWIIDYKTGVHSGGGLDKFLDNEAARYRPQLKRYADILVSSESRPIRAGLYFPVYGAWREVSL